MKWANVPFGSLYQQTSRNGLTKPSRVRGAGVKMVNMGELFAHDRIFDIPMERVPVTERELSTASLEPEDLLFARQSLVLEGAGKCSIVKEITEPTVFESHLIRVRLDSQKAVPDFYYYYFKSPLSPVKSIVSQCAQAGIKSTDLAVLPVLFPPLPTQERIADILAQYDKLIENNCRQIKLLEEAAQRLYKEWFVDLRFPGHEYTPITDGVPQGWSRGTYGDAIDFNPKVQLRKHSTYLKVPMNALSTSAAVIDMSGCEWTASKGGAKFENGDTLFARITPCLENGKTGLWYSEASAQAVGSTEFIVMRSRCLNPYMVYSITRTESFRQMAQGTFVGADGRQRAQVDKMQEASYLRPDHALIQEHQKAVEPLMQRMFLLNRQNNILAEARDRLLPKLMSGEIEVHALPR